MALTEEEHDLLHSTTEQFYKDFCKLVNETSKRVPSRLKPHLLVMLQEHSSVYAAVR
jgi:hypothetical protein